MDGRAGVQPTETNGSVVGDAAAAAPMSASGPTEPARLPLTIREVVRRARQDFDAVERLRAEVDELRVRAESAEHLLGSAPGETVPNAPIAVRPRRLVLKGEAHRELAPVAAPEDPASATRNGYATNGHATNGHATNGHATNGHATNGHATNGHATNGHATNGHATNGHATNGHATDAPAGDADGAANGHSPTNGRVVAPSTVGGWAPAATLPRSKRS